ncbi:hypothetical protein GCM10007047_27880 [Cerasicoccus arenae]|uniref:Uncharacterized protein n=2 Tax=Cerasicoccus arenae TaxID=424488 RepID=A0A8J3GF65_9BACT|nr:hypothetical protein GCM10007047_27880 [Cerasicoccus arenae]
MAKVRIRQGQLAEDKRLLYDSLRRFPADFVTRELLRKTIAITPSPKLTAFARRMEQSYLGLVPSQLETAGHGWNYAVSVDQRFLDTSIQRFPRERIPKSRSHTVGKPFSLDELLKNPNIEKRWRAALRHSELTNGGHLVDSFGLSRKNTRHRLIKRLQGDGLKIVIFGAGPVGLALANSLKRSFGHQINILVTDTRVQRPGLRAPYKRRWLTQISNNMLADLYEPVVRQLFRGWGNQAYVGATIGVWETILLSSCHQQGVIFWFEEMAPLDVLAEQKPHLYIDASGGRLNLGEANKVREQPTTASLAVPIRPYSTVEQLAPMGIRRIDACRDKAIIANREGDWHIPQWNGGPVKLAMFKMTGIPVELYNPLLKWITPRNRDRLFYLWEGKLHSDINELLLLINLTKEAYWALAESLPRPSTFAKTFGKTTFKRLHLDLRIYELVRYIRSLSPEWGSWGVEPPFLYEPRLRTIGKKLERYEGVPIIPIGDSLFNGHPKVGNGLGAHLKLVRRLHDLAILHYE